MPAKTIQGIITKAGAMTKTVTMTIQKTYVHPKLLKSYVRHKKYLIHDEANQLSVGDQVIAKSCRPISARKRYTFLQKVGTLEKLAEGLMSAEDKEKIRIEQLIKDEIARRGGFTKMTQGSKK